MMGHVKALLLTLLLLPAAAAAEWREAASGRYVCDDGSLAELDLAAYGPSLRWGITDTPLSRVATVSGFAFAGGGIAITGSGSTVRDERLEIRRGQEAPRQCRAVPLATAPGIITGSVLYRQRIALPPDARLAVELRDTALADAPAPLLARADIRPRGNQVPLHFRLDHDPAKVAPHARLALSARITDAAGRLLWISDTFTPPPVGEGGAHAEATIMLVPVAR